MDENPGAEDDTDPPRDDPGDPSTSEPIDPTDQSPSQSEQDTVTGAASPARADRDRDAESIDPTDDVADATHDSQQSIVTGPADDEEKPLADHIGEMLKRLGIVIAVAGIVSLVTFPIADQLINFLWNSLLPAGETTRPRLYGILELTFTELKVASLIGLIIALPVLVYQTYQFMRPGLYPHERRYYLAAVPTSLVLAIIGVAFAYVIILPVIFTYFMYYSQDIATIGFALGKTFDLIILLMGYLAIVFQIPLFIMLAIMMNLVTRRWLADRRIIFWGAFLGLSFLFSPDPTGMAPFMVAVTMILLFEGTLVISKWTQRARRPIR